MNDVFNRPKKSPTCLSRWQVSRLSLGLLENAKRFEADAHLASCEHCAAAIADEKNEINAATLERPPEALTNLSRDPPRRGWLLPLNLALLGASVAVVVVIAVLPGVEAPQLRLKGGSEVEWSVLRGENLVAHGVPLAKLGALRDGDRLRVRGPKNTAWVALQGWEQGAWVSYYVGAPASDRWLPVGIALTNEGTTRLRLTTCKAASNVPTGAGVPLPDGCTAETYELEVVP